MAWGGSRGEGAGGREEAWGVWLYPPQPYPLRPYHEPLVVVSFASLHEPTGGRARVVHVRRDVDGAHLGTVGGVVGGRWVAWWWWGSMVGAWCVAGAWWGSRSV